MGIVHEAFIEEVYVKHCRVQDSAEEQTLEGVVCSLEDNACVVAVAVDSFNTFDELVDTCCTNLVFTLGVTLDLPGCLEGVDVDGGAVVEDCLGVQANLCSNLAVYFLSFEAEAVVGVELVFTLEGTAPDAGTGDNAHGFRDGGARAILGEAVEVRTKGVGAQVQGTALLELRGILLVDFIERVSLALCSTLGDEEPQALSTPAAATAVAPPNSTRRLIIGLNPEREGMGWGLMRGSLWVWTALMQCLQCRVGGSHALEAGFPSAGAPAICGDGRAGHAMENNVT